MYINPVIFLNWAFCLLNDHILLPIKTSEVLNNIYVISRRKALHEYKRLFNAFVFVLFSCFSLYSQAQIVRIEDDHSVNDTNALTGSFDLNFYAIQNSKQLFKLSTGSQVKYQKEKYTLQSLNELRFIIAGSNNLENRGFQHLRFQRRLDSTFTWEVFSQIQFDQVLKIKSRFLNGTGPRIQFFRKSKSKVFLGMHYMYEYEEEYETNLINNDHRMSAHLAFYRKLKKSYLHLVSYFQPNLAGFSDYRVSGSLSYSVELRKQLRFNIRGELTYDSEPVTGVNKLNYTVMNGFTFNF